MLICFYYTKKSDIFVSGESYFFKKKICIKNELLKMLICLYYTEKIRNFVAGESFFFKKKSLLKKKY